MQRRHLVRTRNLAAFRHALVDLALAGAPLEARRRVVIVPTRAAAGLLRSTIEQRAAEGGQPGFICPNLFTRDEWLMHLLAVVPGAGRWLSRVERTIILERAARDVLARRRRLEAPFELRPGLVAAMLDFYDEIRRRQRRIRAFARSIFDELRVERGTDRGSEGLIDQTRFLGLAFLAYERLARTGGGVDEHELARLLLAEQPVLPVDDLVIAVADHPADPRGLWPSDFDLMGRLRGLASIHVVMTDEAHDAGFRDRVEQELPGIEEIRAPDIMRTPSIVALPGDPTDTVGVPLALSRDREEELRGVARHIHARGAGDATIAGTTAIVFHRPLPYLYLAQQVLTDARLPYEAADALPLAGEPYAALLDLALAVARTEGAREASLALLRSPLLRFSVDDSTVSAEDVAAFDRVLADRRASGGAQTFVSEVDAWATVRGTSAARHAAAARRAARAAAEAAEALLPFRTATSGSLQVRSLSRFLRAHEVRLHEDGEPNDRFRRARAAVLAVLDHLADALARHDDRQRSPDELAAVLYHAIEGHTFAPERRRGGIQLVDAAAARFGEFDDVFLVGLVETDWADRPRRSLFYSASLLKALGWPQAADQTAAQQAAFRDVLTLARYRTRLSAFELDGDAAVALSTMIDAVRGLPTVQETLADAGPVFADEILTRGVVPDGLEPVPAAWLTARLDRPDLERPPYSGFVPPRAAETYRVSRVDRYVTCPFKYFAEHLLRLTEERDEDPGLTPLERGTFLHLVLERFYRRWHAEGRGSITAANLQDARAHLLAIADEAMAGLPEADRIVEHLRMVGSLVAPGAADRVFDVELAAAGEVSDRLLEFRLEGDFVFPVRGGLSERRIAVRGQADRVDVLSDGSLRVIDYKLGRMPDLDASVQVAVYAHCVQQWLEQRDGPSSHPIVDAMYLAFGDERRLAGRLADAPGDVAYAVHARAGHFADAVDRIESGEFPPRPRHVSECQWCGYSGVCRKEYRIEDDEPAQPV